MTEFTSLEDLLSYIEEYENQHFIQLWKRDTRNIESMKKVCPLKLTNCNAELQYYSITFACSRGGRKFQPRSTGLRNSVTTKNDCPMNIKIKLSSDGQKLQISSVNENHNHNIDKDTFHLLPKQRKLDSEEKNQAKQNKKLLQAGSLQNKTESKSKVSPDQTSILCNFFEENPEVLRGYKRTPKCMDNVQIKWKNITPLLNAVGPPRDHRSWAKYLCDMKAKLKRKSIKWRQSCDGKDPIMCNTNDFNEIRLRMLQVLRKDASSAQESQDSHTSDLETEDDNNDHNKGENYEIEILPRVKPKLEYLEQHNPDINDTPPPDVPLRPLVFEDEFDYFGKNVSEQLRTLPLVVALETQEMLLSVLKKQRLKVLQDPLLQN